MCYFYCEIMEELENYFKNMCNVNNPNLDDLPKHEIKLLSNAMNNINIANFLNDTLSGKFYNCLGNIMKEKKMYNDAKKHYLTAVEKGYPKAIYNLGIYYFDIKKNYSKSKKYYLMAIKHGDSFAMNNMGANYYNVKKKYKKAKKYYLMAIKQNNTYAMCNLAIYYEQIKKNYNKAVKYYCLAIENGDTKKYFYFEMCVEKCCNYESFINCHVSLIKNNNFTFVDKLNKFVGKHFNGCANSIVKNVNILQKHLNILKNVKFIDKNYCANCNKYTLLTKSNCDHHFCLACNNLLNKCLICKQSLKKIDFENY